MNGPTGHWLELNCEVCVVTGAASGIGAAVARSLAQAGARVALLDRDLAGGEKLAAELVALGGTAVAVACDTSQEVSVSAAAERVQAEMGPCHALVNNAGLLRAGALAGVSIGDWNAVLAVNLTGYLLCARAFGAPMRQAGRGGTSSMLMDMVARPGFNMAPTPVASGVPLSS